VVSSIKKKPVFIIGINRRSGTNYLYNLLVNHPDCQASLHEGEDFLLYGADKLEEYYKTVTSMWDEKNWNNDKNNLLRGIESGIFSYLEPSDNCTHYVTKTPAADNLELFNKIFPHAYLLIIIRGGQDLVTSYYRSFNKSFVDCVRLWIHGAKIIDKFMSQSHEGEKFLIIKYEELFSNNKSVMMKILDFLKLDIAKYDFEHAGKLEIIGSSDHKKKKEKLAWKPVQHSNSFNPLGRYKEWNRLKHYRFNWLAGKLSLRLGYPLFYYNPYDPFYYLYNFIAPLLEGYSNGYVRIRHFLSKTLKGPK
jgi:hypothetical protein